MQMNMQEYYHICKMKDAPHTSHVHRTCMRAERGADGCDGALRNSTNLK